MGKEGKFKKVAATEKNDNWDKLIERLNYIVDQMI